MTDLENIINHRRDPLNVALFPNDCNPEVICNELEGKLGELGYEYTNFYIGATGRNVARRSKDKDHRYRSLHLLSTYMNITDCAEAEEACIANLHIDGKTKLNTSLFSGGLKAIAHTWSLYIGIGSGNTAQSLISNGNDPTSRCRSENDPKRTKTDESRSDCF